jgi:hypothetical protein
VNQISDDVSQLHNGWWWPMTKPLQQWSTVA